MSVSYNRLWKLLIDSNISKSELRQKSGVAPSTFSKMNKGEAVSLDVLERICSSLNCNIGDVIEFTGNIIQLDEKER